MPQVSFNTKFSMVALIVATVLLYVAFGGMLWFTHAFFGDVPLLIAVLFLLPPLATTLYSFNRVRAVRKGENPKF